MYIFEFDLRSLRLLQDEPLPYSFYLNEAEISAFNSISHVEPKFPQNRLWELFMYHKRCSGSPCYSLLRGALPGTRSLSLDYFSLSKVLLLVLLLFVE